MMTFFFQFITFKSAGSSLLIVYNISLFIYVAKFVQSSSSNCFESIFLFSFVVSDSTLFTNDSNLFASNLFQVLRKFDARKIKF